MSDKTEGCESCRAWYEAEMDGAHYGECRRHSPRIPSYQKQAETQNGTPCELDKSDGDSQIFRVWPLTYSDDWCCEFVPYAPKTS